MKRKIYAVMVCITLVIGGVMPFAQEVRADGRADIGVYVRHSRAGATVASGNDSNFAIRADGGLWAWGWNGAGQFGDGTNVYRHIPAWVMGDVISVSAGSNCDTWTGNNHTAVIRRDRSLWMWGANNSGQLGDGTLTSRFSPIWVMDDVIAVSTGGGQTNAITMAVRADNSLYAWGSNSGGRFGNGTNQDSLVPVWIMDDVAAVSVGPGHTAVIKTDGTLWTWGANDFGQLGDGTTGSRFAPLQIKENVVAVSVGSTHTAAITSDGRLWMWGSNRWGELGDGSRDGSPFPRHVKNDVVAVSAGRMHTVAVTRDGGLWTWGSNIYGQLGDGTNNDSNTPVQIVDGYGRPWRDVISVSTGGLYTTALRRDGSLWTWGNNVNGQLGDGTAVNRSTPSVVLDQMLFPGSWLSITPIPMPTPHPLPTPSPYPLPTPTPTPELTPTPTPPAEPPAIERDAVYIYDPTPPALTFTPNPGTLFAVSDPTTAESEIRALLASLTSAQISSGDAVNNITLHIENLTRRGTTQELPQGGHADRLAISTGAQLAGQIRQTMTDALGAQGVELLRRPRTGINFRADNQHELTVTFPEDVSDIDFDYVTIEGVFASFSINRENIVPGGTVSIRLAESASASASGVGFNVITASAEGGGFGETLFDFSSPGRVLANFWSLIFIGLLVLASFLLARKGRKLRLWVVPTLSLVAVAINIGMVAHRSGGYDHADIGYADENGTAQNNQPPVAGNGATVLREGVFNVTLDEGKKITLSLPSGGFNTDFLVLADENGGVRHSRFNPSTGNIDASVNNSGVFTLMENRVNFDDIQNESRLTQDVILKLASAGIMDGRATGRFYPNEPITREEFVAAMVAAFDLLDLNAETTFTDVNQSHRFYHAIATAENERIIPGFYDNTFRGELAVPKDQFVEVSAWLLANRMGYRYPANAEHHLSRFGDRHAIADWAAPGIALAVEANLLIYRTDAMFAPQSQVNRGDAAIIIYRVFGRVW